MASTRRDQYPLSSTSQGQNSNKPGLTKGRTAPFSGSVSARTGPASGSFVIRGQDLQPTDVFDTLWRWLVERQAIDHKRRSGKQAPCVGNINKQNSATTYFLSLLGGRPTRVCSSIGSATHIGS